jgi:ABC-type glycerol-3-phosphate transport system substrate-binding protein
MKGVTMKAIYLLVATLLVAALVVGCGAAPESPSEQPEIVPEAEEPQPAPEEVPVLRISAPQYMIDEGLEGTIRAAIENSGMPGGLDFTLEGYPGLPPGIRTMCAAPDLPFLFPDSQVEEAYPDLMLVDSQAINQFEPSLVSDVPGDIWEASGLTESARRAYTDLNGRLIGLAQGTRPAMMVYNRGTFGEHPIVQGLAAGGQPALGWEQMSAIREKLGADGQLLSIPPMAALIAAEIQGMGMNPEEIFENPAMLFELADRYGGEMERIFGGENVGSYDPDQMQPFENPQAAFAMLDSGFLGQMAGSEQQVDVLPLPAIIAGQPATSAQMLGWVVPAKANNPEQAWKLANALVQDAEMNRFGLRYGLLPTTEAGIESLGEWAGSNLLLPGNLQTLKDLARHSVAWHIPARFRTAECRQRFNDFMMNSDEILAQLAEKSLNGYAAAETVASMLSSLQSCSP